MLQFIRGSLPSVENIAKSDVGSTHARGYCLLKSSAIDTRYSDTMPKTVPFVQFGSRT